MVELDRRGRMVPGSRAVLDGTFEGPDELMELLAMYLHLLGAASAKLVCLGVIFLQGGPEQQELWDPKPDALDTIRGPFKTIRTNVPGMDLGEHQPLLAKWADKYTLVRTVDSRSERADRAWGRPRSNLDRLPHRGIVRVVQRHERHFHPVALQQVADGRVGGVVAVDPGELGRQLQGRQNDPAVALVKEAADVGLFPVEDFDRLGCRRAL